MSAPKSIPLVPIRTAPGLRDYLDLLMWPFSPHQFFEVQITRLLQSDIPYRVMFSNGLVWVYRDPDGNTVGFGTLDICNEYDRFTGGRIHVFIPLLAVNPGFQKRGHGRTIVQHLIAESTGIIQSQSETSSILFLDVYRANSGAIALYEKCGFAVLNPDTPIPDPQENNEPYFIMAKGMSVPQT